MSTVHVDKVVSILPEFIAQRVAPNTSGLTQFAAWGLVGLLASPSGSAAARSYVLELGQMGLVDGDGNIDVDAARAFVDSAFSHVPTVRIKGIVFDKSDADALFSLISNGG